MADTEQEDTPKRRKLREPIPWTRFWWQEWLSDSDLRRLTPDQRGRFMDVWAISMGTRTPGVMLEEDVRTWAGYTPEEWADVRETFAKLFSVARRTGKWTNKRVKEDHEASLNAYMVGRERALKAVAGRRRRKDLATTSITTSTTPSCTPSQPGVQLGVRQDVRTETLEPRTKKTDKPDSRAARAQNARSRAGSAGSAGSTPPEPLAGIIARATGMPTPSEGRGA